MVTRDDILDRIDPISIFRYYCPPFKKLGKKFKSELRSDSEPSAAIFNARRTNTILYKDLATGDTFDCIRYVMTKYSLNYFQALRAIDNDFNLNLFNDAKEAPPTMAFFGVPEPEVIEEKPKTKIEVKVREWNKTTDKAYWYDRYGIGVKTLDFFNVVPLSAFAINDNWSNCGKNSYGYYMGEDEEGREYWKIYQPLADKRRKWFSNVCEDVLQGDEYNLH